MTKRFQGRSYEERQHHINFLELKASFFRLKCFVKHKTNINVLLRIDNTTAISYINKMGGIRFPELSRLARELWQWGEARNIWVFASYVKSIDIADANFDSRKLPLETEYELNQDIFENIVSQYGQPEIDLFASRINKKCRKFASWKKDPEACIIDAFAIDWSHYFLYAFPPFSLLLSVFRKMVQDKACGVVVVPFWTSQAWYPLFLKYLISESIYFQPRPDLLFSVDRAPHPL